MEKIPKRERYMKTKLGTAAGVLAVGLFAKQPEFVWAGFMYGSFKATQLLNKIDREKMIKYRVQGEDLVGMSGYAAPKFEPEKAETPLDPAPPLVFEISDNDVDMIMRAAEEAIGSPGETDEPS